MQTGILKTVPHLSTYLSFNLADATTKTVAIDGLKQLLQMADGQRTVVGFSAALCKTLGIKAPKELHAFKTPAGGKLKLPETPVDLLVWLRAKPAQDRGDLLTISRLVQALLGDGFVLREAVEAFIHLKKNSTKSHDLTGYEDGTEGFTLRRSMPWSDGANSGLMFAAFGKSFEAFDLQLARMVGADDGITDAVFKMSKPMTGSFFWCPPVVDGQIKCY